jgi:transcription elongation factor GreA
VPTDVPRITQETLDKLQEEYDFLTTIGRTEIARTIETARLLGDLSENGDYHAAKDDQGKMEARIRQIDQILRNHEIVERAEHVTIVTHAAVVSVVYDGDDDSDVQQFFIGSIEEKPDGAVVASPTSPLGSALLGRRVGDEVDYEAPSGILRVRIVALQ